MSNQLLIIGAGPAGLAAAYQLKRRGLPYRVLEKNAVGHAWQHHYDRLRLHTLKQVSGLPGLPMPANYPHFPARAQFLAYLQQYARYFELNIETGVEVFSAIHGAAGWQLETSRGPVYGHTLIAATGIWSRPHRPEFEAEAQFNGTVIHARDYRNPAPFTGQRVLVVGGGNTGCELAVDLADAGVESSIAIPNGAEFVPFPGSVRVVRGAAWFFRHAPHGLSEWLLHRVRRNFSHLGLHPAKTGHVDTYPVVGYHLPEAVEAGRVRVFDCGIRRFLQTGVEFEDGRRAPFDAVILATGYRPALKFIGPRDLELDAGGRPCLHRWRSTRNPHLFCVGYHYPSTEGWLQSLGRVTREMAEQL